MRTAKGVVTEGANKILVVGGGIAGMTAAVEAAEVGHPVILVEKEATLGGRVMQMHRYFPKMCPPGCGFELNVRRIRSNPRITVHTLATVKEVTGIAGAFRATIRIQPRYVTGDRPLDESLSGKLTSERANPFNYGMDKTGSIYLPHDMAYPAIPVLDRKSLSKADLSTLRTIASPAAINLEMQEEELQVDVGSVVLATGWKPYDAAKLDNFGFGTCENVITNVMMERLAAPGGPTGGEIVRPSDGKKPKNVAFVQCAGSRDENHLRYCSSVCCMASLKQARYIRESIADSKVTIFYIDIRAIGRHDSFYRDLADDPNFTFTKGKVARITEDPDSTDLLLDVEDTLTSENLHNKFDLVVLATGMVPNTVGIKFPFELCRDEYGFAHATKENNGVFVAGCATHPCDVSRTTKDSTAAALKAIQCL